MEYLTIANENELKELTPTILDKIKLRNALKNYQKVCWFKLLLFIMRSPFQKKILLVCYWNGTLVKSILIIKL